MLAGDRRRAVGAARSAGRRRGCPHWGRPAVAADPRPHALRVFAIQFEQHPAAMRHRRRLPARHRLRAAHRGPPPPGRGRPNLVVFDEDIGLETIAVGPRGAAARALLRRGNGCTGDLCLHPGHPRRHQHRLRPRAHLPAARGTPRSAQQLGRGFVAATDTFVRVFMTTMAAEARRHHLYIIASNTQAPFALTPQRGGGRRRCATPARRGCTASTRPPPASAYDQTFVWGPRVVHRHAPAPAGQPAGRQPQGPADQLRAGAGLQPRPVRRRRGETQPRARSRIPGTGARLGIATSLPAFEYGTATPRPRLRRRDQDLHALPGPPRGQRASSRPTPTTARGRAPTAPTRSSTGSRCRGWARPTARSATRASTSHTLSTRSWSATWQTPRSTARAPSSSAGCAAAAATTSATRASSPAMTTRSTARYAGSKPQFLALAPWVAPDGPRAALRDVGAAAGRHRPARRPLRPDRADRRPPLPRRPQPHRLRGGRPMTEHLAPRGDRGAPPPRRWPATPPAPPPRPGHGAAPPGAARRADVIVIGAGLAGLAAASDLVHAGHSVVVLEARDRVGGRTLNHPVGDGEVVEVGGQWVGPGQDRILARARALGIQHVQDLHQGRPDLRLPRPADPLHRAHPAAAAGPTPPTSTRCSPRSCSCTSTVPLDKPWTAPDALALDGQTLETWKLANSSTPGARFLFDLATESVFAAEPRDLSLLHALFYFHSGNGVINLTSTAGGAQDSRFVGGSQLVSIRMAQRLGRRVVLNAPVRRIAHAAARGHRHHRRRHLARQGRDRRHGPDAGRTHRLRPAAPRRARPAHPARAPGLGDQVRGRLPQAVLARRGAQRATATATARRSASPMTTPRPAGRPGCCWGS